MTFCGVFFVVQFRLGCRDPTDPEVGGRALRLSDSFRLSDNPNAIRSPLVGFFPIIRQPQRHPLSACRILSGYPTTPVPSALRLSDSFRLSDNPNAIRAPLVGFFPVIRQLQLQPRSACRILFSYPTTTTPTALRLSDPFQLSDNYNPNRATLVGFFPVIRQLQPQPRSVCRILSGYPTTTTPTALQLYICKRATSLEAALLKNAVTIIYSCLPIGNGWFPSLAARLLLYPMKSNMGCCFRLLRGGSGIRRFRLSCLPSSY